MAHMKTQTRKLTVRDIPADIHSALYQIAKADERPMNWIILQAIREYVSGPAKDATEIHDARCETCGAFTWTRLHHATCVAAKRPAKVAGARRPARRKR